MLKPLLFIGAGGFLGSTARYALQGLISQKWPFIFPWGTFTVNIIGCLLIGILVGIGKDQFLSDPIRLLLITGFCGGFTTFSTFSMEGLGLLQQQQIGHFLWYSFGSVAAGLGATYLGFIMVR